MEGNMTFFWRYGSFFSEFCVLHSYLSSILNPHFDFAQFPHLQSQINFVWFSLKVIAHPDSYRDRATPFQRYFSKLKTKSAQSQILNYKSEILNPQSKILNLKS